MVLPYYELDFGSTREVFRRQCEMLARELPRVEAEFRRERPDLYRLAQVMSRGAGEHGVGQR